MPQETIRQAVIVAAGFGSRLQPLRPGGRLIKPLEPVGKSPILRRVLDGAIAAGISRVVIVTGHLREELEEAVRQWPLPCDLSFAFNPDYRLSNGISLLRGAQACRGDFALLMSDHLFEAETLTALLRRGLAGDLAVLAVDSKIDRVFDLDDATKVVADGDRIRRIGKGLKEYNAIDTGMFLISQSLTEILDDLVRQTGDASISAAMNAAIAANRMGAFDIGEGFWQDVDTPEMLAEAERQVALGRYRSPPAKADGRPTEADG